MLTVEMAKFLESRLRAERAKLATALDLDMGDGKVVELAGRLSHADAVAGEEMSRATRARTQTELRRVDAAIARFENGRFGLCCRCQDPVELDRLSTDPATPFCLLCVEEMSEERQDRRSQR